MAKEQNIEESTDSSRRRGSNLIDLEEEIQRLMLENEGLLDREAAEMLLMSDKEELKPMKLSEIKAGDSLTAKVKIEEIPSVREFNKKNGGTGHVVNITITDGSDSKKLVLWDEQTELVTEDKIHEGMEISLKNCYVKETNYGIEVSLGKFGELEIE
jgi:replication factor A1